MKVRISLSDKKTASGFDFADFNRKAEVIFKKEVLPQIANARKSQKPSNAVKCNNPI